MANTNLDALSEAQKTAYRAVNVRLGLDPDFASHDGSVVIPAGVTRWTSDPNTSGLQPTLIPVADIAEMKRMIGIPDENFRNKKFSDQAIFYPPPIASLRMDHLLGSEHACQMQSRMTSDERTLIDLAAAAYMQGNSAKVLSFEPLLNFLFFPSRITAFSVGSVVVQGHLVLDAQNPAVNASMVTVHPEGQIECLSYTTFNAQIFTVLSE